MPIFDVKRIGCVLSLSLVAAMNHANALEVPTPSQPLKTIPFGSVSEAMRSGVRTYNAGDKLGATKALEYAASGGHALALWKLGRMYADGDGVPQDDLKAFEYFSKIVDHYTEDRSSAQHVSVVSNAFVMIGQYFLYGIKESYVKPNPARAQEFLHYAAAYFGHATAQYYLGKFYLEGLGEKPDALQAARWLNLAAEKGQYQAQALLGQLLMEGREGVAPQKSIGLMWLTLARDAANAEKDAWILASHDQAFATASLADRRVALALLEDFMRKKR
jgi:uncharacterized protein